MKVLYATDGLEAAFLAKHVIAKLFDRDGTRITVVSVTHSWSFDPGHIMLELDPIVERRGDSKRIVDDAASDLRDEGFEVSTRVLEGTPGRELVKLARSGYDLVIVGAGSHSWLGNRLLGSVSTYLLHECPCSVMIVHEPPMSEGVGRIVVGVDGSYWADQTVTMLTRLLDPRRCEIEVMSAVPHQAPVLAPSPALMVPIVTDMRAIARAEAELVAQAERHLQEAAEVFRAAGFPTTTGIERGGVAPALLEEAKQIDADLVAVGSRGLGPIRRALLGSVSDHIARHARAALIGRSYGDRGFDNDT